MGLSKEIASHCKGEPLALEVLGSFFSDRSLVEWRSTFAHLKRTGFDSLCDDKEKDELPCIAKDFFHCSLPKCDSENNVRQRRCLANVGQKKLMYRELLQALGREIAWEESSKNPRNNQMTLKTGQKESQLQDPEIETSAMYPEATPSEHSGHHPQTTSPVDESKSSIPNKVKFVCDEINMLGKNADAIVHGFREHVRLSPGITAMVRGKLSFGARVLQLGGTEKLFRELFSWEDGEKLMESFECYWLTSTSPIAAGLLFISTEKFAFWSERSVEVVSPGGGSTKIHYEMKVPIRNIKAVNEAENVERPLQKYINIVTVDDSDFWFTGFFNHQKALKNLRRAIHQE
ncbi:hypothetical protein NL676_004863 [Syzygium grande]|nr:hypothetical protein NL676_004863 [Syzygium grande]